MDDPADIQQVALRLVGFNTINPPGGEDASARYVGEMLRRCGFEVTYHAFAPGRTSVVATLGNGRGSPPICLTGHLDTVPLGNAPWTRKPFGEIANGKLYGRGSSDMKGAIAAMIAAACDLRAALPRSRCGLTLVFTAGEETGCEGARHLGSAGVLGSAGAVVVGEPTENEPVLGHKGAMWLRAVARGKTAHGSMPELGVNAFYKLARQLLPLEHLAPGTADHPMMGRSSLNVGTFSSGKNVNSVPDEAQAELDIRIVPGDDARVVLRRVCECLGPEVQVDTLLNVQELLSDADHSWIRRVYGIAQPFHKETLRHRTVPFFTDGPALAQAFGGAPVVILGPGESRCAHQTDEYCDLQLLHDARKIYRELVMDWCGIDQVLPPESTVY